MVFINVVSGYNRANSGYDYKWIIEAKKKKKAMEAYLALCRTAGYCWVKWFNIVEAVAAVKKLGPYPRIKDVLSFMMISMDVDKDIYDVDLQSNDVCHVVSRKILFSELLRRYMFSDMKVGASVREATNEDIDYFELQYGKDIKLRAISDTPDFIEQCRQSEQRRVLQQISYGDMAQISNAVYTIPKKTINLGCALTAEQLLALNENFGQYLIRPGVSLHHHGMAKAVRILRTAEVADVIGCGPNTLGEGRRSTIKLLDVGGGLTPVTLGIPVMHTCKPVLSSRDYQRVCVWNEYFSNKYRMREIKKNQYYSVRHEKDCMKERVCASESQYCKVQAEVMMAIDSLYDVAVEDIPVMMRSHGCKRLLATINFEPTMAVAYLHDDKLQGAKRYSGIINDLEMNWRIESRNGKRVIVCWFKNDCDQYYIHDYDNFMRLVMEPVILGANLVVLRSIVNYKLGTLLMEYRVVEYQIKMEQIIFSIPPQTRNNYLVRVVVPLITAGCCSSYEYKYVYVPKNVFELCEMFVAKQQECKINEFISYFLMKITRFSINSVDINGCQKLDDSEKVVIATNLYVLFIIKKNMCMQLMKTLKANHDALTSSFNFGDIMDYMYSKIMGGPVRDCSKTFSDWLMRFRAKRHPTARVEDVIEVIESETEMDFKMVEGETVEFNVEIRQNQPNEERVNEMVKAMSDYADITKPTKKARQAALNALTNTPNYDKIIAGDALFSAAFRSTDVCTCEKTTFMDVPMDGKCAYTCLNRMFGSHLSLEELKEVLKFLYSAEDYPFVHSDFKNDDVESEAMLNIPFLRRVMADIKVSLCIHAETSIGSRILRSEKDATLKEIVHMKLTYNEQMGHLQIDRVHNMLPKLERLVFDKMFTVSRKKQPFVPFIIPVYGRSVEVKNRGAKKLLELMRHFDLRNVRTALDVGSYPGGMTSVLRQFGVQVDAISKKIEGVEPLSEYVEMDFEDFRGETLYDLVLIDLATDDYKDNNFKHILKAATFVADDGVFIFKLRNALERTSIRLPFAQVQPVKPKSSPLSNTELYYVCRGKGEHKEFNIGFSIKHILDVIQFKDEEQTQQQFMELMNESVCVGGVVPVQSIVSEKFLQDEEVKEHYVQKPDSVSSGIASYETSEHDRSSGEEEELSFFWEGDIEESHESEEKCVEKSELTVEKEVERKDEDEKVEEENEEKNINDEEGGDDIEDEEQFEVGKVEITTEVEVHAQTVESQEEKSVATIQNEIVQKEKEKEKETIEIVEKEDKQELPELTKPEPTKPEDTCSESSVDSALEYGATQMVSTLSDEEVVKEKVTNYVQVKSNKSIFTDLWRRFKNKKMARNIVLDCVNLKQNKNVVKNTVTAQFSSGTKKVRAKKLKYYQDVYACRFNEALIDCDLAQKINMDEKVLTDTYVDEALDLEGDVTLLTVVDEMPVEKKNTCCCVSGDLVKNAAGVHFFFNEEEMHTMANRYEGLRKQQVEGYDCYHFSYNNSKYLYVLLTEKQTFSKFRKISWEVSIKKQQLRRYYIHNPIAIPPVQFESSFPTTFSFSGHIEGDYSDYCTLINRRIKTLETSGEKQNKKNVVPNAAFLGIKPDQKCEDKRIGRTPVDHYNIAYAERMEYLKVCKQHHAVRYKAFYEKISKTQNVFTFTLKLEFTKEKLSVYNNELCEFIIESDGMKRAFQKAVKEAEIRRKKWGDLECMIYAFDGKDYVEYSLQRGKFNTKERLVILSEFTLLLITPKIYERLQHIEHRAEMPAVYTISGVAGCGKTTTIVNLAKKNDLVLTQTIAGKEEVQDAIDRMKTTMNVKDVRTTASLALNGVKRKYNVVFVDEAFMTHPGDIPIIVDITKAKLVVLFGDEEQIPYIDRDHFINISYTDPLSFSALLTKQLRTYRSPMDVVYLVKNIMKHKDGRNVYPQQYHTTSEVLHSVKTLPAKEFDPSKHSEKTLFLAMTHSEVATLREKFMVKNAATIDEMLLMSVHQAQGQTYDEVVLYRCNQKPLEIYESVPHLLVAVTRHKKSFTYYVDIQDTMGKWIKSLKSVPDHRIMSDNEVEKNKYTPVDTAKMLNELRARMEKDNCSEKDDEPDEGVVEDAEEISLSESEKKAIDETLSKVKIGGFVPVNMFLNKQTHAVAEPVVERICKNYESQLHPVINYACALPKTLVKHPELKLNVRPNVSMLQSAIDELGFTAVEPNDFQMLVEESEQFVYIDKIQLDPARFRCPVRKFDTLRPALKTVMPAERLPSTKQTVLAFKGRNANVPVLRNDSDPLENGYQLGRNFMNTYVSPMHADAMREFAAEPIMVNKHQIITYIKNQDPDYYKKLQGSKVGVDEIVWNEFSYMIKTKLKPPSNPADYFKFATVQSIAYQDAIINTIFSPIMQQIRDRLLAVLDSRFHIYTNMSAEQFQDRLNECFCAETFLNSYKVECDHSKYDKSQGKDVLIFECFLMREFGVAEELVELWYFIHEESRYIDRTNGVASTINFQRRSGDTSTFLFNTLFSMAMAAAVYDMSKAIGAVFAGDDSLIWTLMPEHFPDRSGMFADLGNLESKLLRYNYPYFCSKFLLVSEGKFLFVPDPVKWITKLGNNTLRNYDHVEEYRMSCLDNYKIYFNAMYHSLIAKAVSDRYSVKSNITEVLPFLMAFTKSKTAFRELFIFEKGMKLCNDPTRPKRFD